MARAQGRPELPAKAPAGAPAPGAEGGYRSRLIPQKPWCYSYPAVRHLGGETDSTGTLRLGLRAEAHSSLIRWNNHKRQPTVSAGSLSCPSPGRFSREGPDGRRQSGIA